MFFLKEFVKSFLSIIALVVFATTLMLALLLPFLFVVSYQSWKPLLIYVGYLLLIAAIEAIDNTRR